MKSTTVDGVPSPTLSSNPFIPTGNPTCQGSVLRLCVTRQNRYSRVVQPFISAKRRNNDEDDH